MAILTWLGFLFPIPTSTGIISPLTSCNKKSTPFLSVAYDIPKGRFIVSFILKKCAATKFSDR